MTAVREQEIQRAVFRHIAYRGARDLFAWHPFSGGYRRPAEAAIYKGLGARPGLPDVMALHRGTLFCLELKRLGGRPSEIQLATLAALEAAGAITAITEGLDRTIEQLEQWQLLRGHAS
jgi:hypothetical protein